VLFAGGMTPGEARSYVRATGAGALVEPCGSTGRLERVLLPLGFHPTRVGCAVIYTVAG
jgi:hypothetical protein